MVGKAKQFLGFVLPGVIRPIRVLWNEMMGFVFLCLGVIPIPSALRAWQDFQSGSDGPFRLLLTCFFSAIMLYYGVTSFLKAKRISRS